MEDRIDSREEARNYVQMFEEADYSTFTEREVSHRCRDYRDGIQLTSEEITELERRGQPPVVINRIGRKIDALMGIEQQRRTDPQAFPRTPQHEYDANAATEAIRFVCDNNKFDQIRSMVWEDMNVEGTGGCEVIHHFQPPMKEPEIKINLYRYDRLFWDPHSSMLDFSDARYKGAVIWKDVDLLKQQYPDHMDEIEASVGPVDNSQDTFEDKPYYTTWHDAKRNRTRIVLLYYIDKGVWNWVKFVKGGVLERGVSPYVDDKGLSICPLIMQSAYITRDNARYSHTKWMLDTQDEINKRRSKMLHMLNSRQTWGPKGAVKSVKAMKRELAKPDGHVEIEMEGIAAAAELGIAPFNIISQQDQIAGQSALLAESKAEIDLQGANSALAGQGEASSGREVLARQQGGIIEITPLQNKLSNFTLTVYRHIWFAIRQFWTGPKWIRVTDDERNVRFVGLNQPVTLQEHLSTMDREQVVNVARGMGLVPGDPRLQMPVKMQNPVSEMDCDIILGETEDKITLAGETFEQLVGLASSMPGSIPPELLIDAAPNLSRKIKDKILERMEQEAQQRAEMMKRQQQMAEQRNAAEVQEINAGAMEDMEQARKHRAEATQLSLFPMAAG